MKIETPALFRELKLQNGVTDRDQRTVTFSFSSEEPYERSFGWEILSHQPGAMIDDRLRRKAVPLLLNHNWEDQIGSIIEHSIQNGKAYATAKLSRSDRGKEIMQDIQDQIRTNISVGYVVHAMGQVGVNNDDGKDIFRVTKFELLEISLVSVPADSTVGIGRGMSPDSEVEFERALVTQKYANNERLFEYAKAHGGLDNLCDLWVQHKLGSLTAFMKAVNLLAKKDAEREYYGY